ncbi:hypothetical protein ACOMHN_040615 [Nucella lapillus]
MTSTKEYVQRDDGNRRTNRQKGKTRCRKRLSILLHTHVALILVCTLAALDSACVIGQIICDILIMKETLHEWELLDANLTSLLSQDVPLLNATGHGDIGNLNLIKIRDVLLEHRDSPHHGGTNVTALTAQLANSGVIVPDSGLSQQWLQVLQDAAAKVAGSSPGSQGSGTLNLTLPGGNLPAGGSSNATTTAGQVIIGFFKIPVSAASPQAGGSAAAASGASHSRRRRAAEGATAEHDLLHDLTHSFHLGSMILLSMLLLESLLKVFAMGKKILNNKLEVFDAFVVSVSWALDVAFWEGIWAHPGTEAATILIFILPWRVVRIVNSFVLVIQEKDHVQLKIVKQRLRLSVKKSKESVRKASCYRTEVKQLQGLCRKYGATENEINACGPAGRMGRRRSSLMPAMERAASLTLISALGSHPSLYTMGSSSGEEDDATSRNLTRSGSQDPTLRSAMSITTLDSVFTIGGKSQGDDDFTSDNELDNDSTAEGLDNPVFINCDVDETSHHHQNQHHQYYRPSSSSSRNGNPVVLNSTTLEDDAKDSPAVEDVEAGKLAKRLHHRLAERPSIMSNASTVSETSSRSEENSSSRGNSSGADPNAQEIPPRYHEAVSKQDSQTRL